MPAAGCHRGRRRGEDGDATAGHPAQLHPPGADQHQRVEVGGVLGPGDDAGRAVRRAERDRLHPGPHGVVGPGRRAGLRLGVGAGAGLPVGRAGHRPGAAGGRPAGRVAVGEVVAEQGCGRRGCGQRDGDGQRERHGAGHRRQPEMSAHASLQMAVPGWPVRGHPGTWFGQGLIRPAPAPEVTLDLTPLALSSWYEYGMLRRAAGALRRAGADEDVVALHEVARVRVGVADQGRLVDVLEVVALDEHAGVHRGRDAVLVVVVVVVVDVHRVAEPHPRVPGPGAVEPVVVVGHPQVADVLRCALSSLWPSSIDLSWPKHPVPRDGDEVGAALDVDRAVVPVGEAVVVDPDVGGDRLHVDRVVVPAAER